MADLPVVLLPLGADDDALDACLAALDAATPAGTRVWLADDAQVGPRGLAIVERWLACTRLQADYTRRKRRIGEVAHHTQIESARGVVAGQMDVLPHPIEIDGCVDAIILEQWHRNSRNGCRFHVRKGALQHAQTTHPHNRFDLPGLDERHDNGRAFRHQHCIPQSLRFQL